MPGFVVSSMNYYILNESMTLVYKKLNDDDVLRDL